MPVEARLDDLLLHWEELQEKGHPSPPVEELCAGCPELAEPLRQRIQSLQRVRAWLANRAPDVDCPGAPPPEERYRAMRFHARGGLGEVFVARDEELHRDVALKRLRPERACDAESRQRFLREAEITAQLEHPGIVPVFGRVQDRDGQPCYAMRLVQGETLQEAIHRFHAANRKPGRHPAEPHLALRQLLSRFLAACNAVAYAHSRGIVHRDLKPGNILLGPYGETLVVDWGLAKALPGAAERDDGAITVRRQSATGPGGTVLGQVLGTPAYMSPEQAAGRWDRVGPATDIYGLGATLYALLTGRAPLQSKSDQEVLDRVRRGALPPPRQVQAGIPPALEAICLKAMAREPEQRYATLLELATDVEHWLADEPVSVYREPLAIRMGRWARRHRALSAGVAVLGVAAVVSLSAIAVLLEQARTRLVVEQTRTEEQRQQAEASYRLARETKQHIVTKLLEDERLKRGPLEDLRRVVMQADLHFYQRFVELRRDDANFRHERGRAFGQLAKLTHELGSKEEALGYSRQSRAILADLARDCPEVTEYQFELANVQNGLGRASMDTGRLAEAKDAFQAAADIYNTLARNHPDNAMYRASLAGSHNNLGLLYARMGRHAEEEKACHSALAIYQVLAQEHPDVARYRADLAMSFVNLGTKYGSAGRMAEAEQACLKALVLYLALTRDYPNDRLTHNGLASTYLNLGTAYEITHRRPEAERAFRGALAVWKGLAHDHPGIPDYRASLATTRFSLSSLYRASGRLPEAEEVCGDALPLLKALARDYPTVTQYREDLGKSWLYLGTLYQATGHVQEVEPALRNALTIYQALARDHPTHLGYTLGLASTQHRLGRWVRDGGNLEAGLASFHEVLATLRPILARQPQQAECRDLLRRTYQNRATTLCMLNRYEEALPAWDRALELAEDSEPNLRLGRATTLALLGKHDQATREADALARGERVTGSLLYHAARVYALSAKTAPDGTAAADDYPARAVALLRQAVEYGSKEVQHLRDDEDFAPLRLRGDFQQLLTDLRQKRGGKQPLKSP